METQTLLLLPGLMCDEAVWSPLYPLLDARWQIRVVDYGMADSLPAMAACVLAAAPPGRVAIAGHSMGGRVALEVLRQAPERISHVALLDTGHLPRAAGEAGAQEAAKRHALLDVARTQGVATMARTWVQGMVHPARLQDAGLLDAVIAMFARKSAVVFAAQITALLNRPDASGVLSALQIPVLLQCGAQDAWSPPAQHEAMRALAPHAVLDVIPDAGHMAPMERPEAVAASLSRWLACGAPA